MCGGTVEHSSTVYAALRAGWMCQHEAGKYDIICAIFRGDVMFFKRNEIPNNEVDKDLFKFDY